MQQQTLQDKTAQSLAQLASLLDQTSPQHIAVAFSGGKDSTVALDLWRRVLAERHPETQPRALSLDTGFKFPEVLACRDQIASAWNVDLSVARAHIPPDFHVAPNPVDPVACCRLLKVAPLKAALTQQHIAILITGIRRDEHPSRASLTWLESHTDPPHQRAHPLLDFTEMDVWAHILTHNLPHCTLYDQGYRSLGCQPCTEVASGSGPERQGRAAGKEARLEELQSLGYF